MNYGKTTFSLISLIGVALSIAAYWAGLSGPLLFDDFWNLAPIARWQTGQQSLLSTLLPNPDSVILSRPVSMAALMLNVTIAGTGIFTLKLGNLLLHLIAGVSGGIVLQQLMSRDINLAKHSYKAAALATLIWLVHPSHVSTVLYVVQRMAQLATIFSLIAVLLYVYGRRGITQEASTKTYATLFIAFPAAVILGLLSKQNAAVTPFICLAIEIAYFSKNPRPDAIRIFFLAFAIVPTIAALSVVAISPMSVLGDYSNWDFTLGQRLLTQPRALMDYILMWFIPRTAEMGLYTDDYVISTGLLTPASTLVSIAILAGITTWTILKRRSMPSLFAGWFFFLAAHSIEASFLPLEMYYEHRNYLPAFGLLLSSVAVLHRASLLAGGQLRSGAVYCAFAAVALMLSFATFARSLVWESELAMTEQGILHHPDSIRARLDRLSISLRREDYQSAIDTLEPMLTHHDPRHRFVGRMDLLVVNCLNGKNVDLGEIPRALSDAGDVITVHEIHVATLQESVTQSGKCSLVPPAIFADGLQQLADAAAIHPESTQNKSTLRRITAQLYARGNRWDLAQKQAQIGWDSNPTIPLGLVLARAYAINGEHKRALAVLDELEAMPRWFDYHWQSQILLARRFVEERQPALAG